MKSRRSSQGSPGDWDPPFVLRNKYNSDGMKEGTSRRGQHPGVDFGETFTSVARMSSIRAIAAIATQNRLSIHHFDITIAYLNGELEEEVFMKRTEYIEEILERITKQKKKDSKIFKKFMEMLKELDHENKASPEEVALRSTPGRKTQACEIEGGSPRF